MKKKNNMGMYAALAATIGLVGAGMYAYKKMSPAKVKVLCDDAKDLMKDMM